MGVNPKLRPDWTATIYTKKISKSSQFRELNTWRNIAELADTSLVNDKINKIEQMCVEEDAASTRNDTKELFNIVKKLNGDWSKKSPSSVNKRNGEPPTSFIELLEEWAEYFKELLNTNSTTNFDEIPPAEQNLNINTESFTFK